MKANCWEVMRCGREPGGAKVSKLGPCPAATDPATDGANGGKNGGRMCWAISGTFCGGKVQGTFAEKEASCAACVFFNRVKDEEGLNSFFATWKRVQSRLARKNCWEFMDCQRGTGGAKVAELGVCPAATDVTCHGLNGGLNGGRICWAMTGTFCGGTVQGTFAAKKDSCGRCDFFKSVKDQEGTESFVAAWKKAVNKLARKNCWEVKNCGREPGGVKVPELGVCPAATCATADGLNGGKNAGRICWAVTGTFCGGKVQGTFAEKEGSCMKCAFYQKVRTEQGMANFLRDWRRLRQHQEVGG